MTGTNFGIFLNSLEHRIQGWQSWKQLAFGAACCERAYPNYVIFSRRSTWGNPQVLREAVDFAWACIATGQANDERLQALKEACRIATPDLDDFPSASIDVLAAAAQECSFMITLLLEFCQKKAPSYAVRIATFARDTIDMYVQAKDGLAATDPHLEAKIEADQLMKSELARQQQDIAILQRLHTTSDLKLFREETSRMQASNIGLSI